MINMNLSISLAEHEEIKTAIMPLSEDNAFTDQHL